MTGPTLDAASWVRRWEDQQAGYVTDREPMFSRMLDVLERLGARPGLLLDLGCGPGSLAERAVRRWPDARVVGLEVDPVMLELGRRTLGERIEWVQADLRAPDWHRRLPGETFDAVVSATAVHWLDLEYLDALAAGLAAVLRPGGVFVNFDKLLTDPANPRLAALITRLRLERQQRDLRGREDWTAWWTDLAREPELAEHFAARERLLPRDTSQTHTPTLPALCRALRRAGFAEVDTLDQVNDRRLLVAIR